MQRHYVTAQEPDITSVVSNAGSNLISRNVSSLWREAGRMRAEVMPDTER